MKKVTFWKHLNGSVTVQKENLFFKIPTTATSAVETDKSFRESIAKNFDTAPMKTASFDLVGAVVIDEIKVGCYL